MADAWPPVKRLGRAFRGGWPAPMGQRDREREERLAAALRENLRRRKAQARDGDQKNDATKDAAE